MIVGCGKYYLYRHVRLDNGRPFYVGIGTKPNRYTTIKSEYPRAFQEGKYRGNIWNKIASKTDYSIEIIAETNDYDFLLQKEVEFVELYGRICNGTGSLANLSTGGDSGAKGIKWTEQSRKNLSASLRGRKIDAETIKKRVESRRLNYKMTDDHKKKISESNKSHPKHQKGIRLSQEIINNMRKAWAGKKVPRHVIDMASEAKKKKVKRVDTGEIFDTVGEAAISAKVARTYFSQRLKRGQLIRKIKYEYYDLS